MLPSARRISLRSALLAPFLLALPACGSLDTQTGTPPTLVTIHGTLDNPANVPINGPVRVAVVWTGGDLNFNVAQDLPVDPVFPSSFSIQLDEVPPPDAISHGGILSWDGGVAATTQIALGTVVAYVDTNGNGKLDLVAQGASGYIDQILAIDPTDEVIYSTLQGTVPSPRLSDGGFVDAGPPPAQGYDLEAACGYSFPTYNPASLCPTQPAPCTFFRHPIDTPIVLTASANPDVNSVMCRQNNVDGDLPSIEPTAGRPATYPDPCDPNLNCEYEGWAYFYEECTTSAPAPGLCGVSVKTCTGVSSYKRPDPVPADWPCQH